VADHSASNEFKVERGEDGPIKTVKLYGVIDEHADLAFLGELRGRVSINLRGVRRINSFGVRSWIDAVRRVAAECALEFIECPPPVIDQMNMVAGFLGRGKVLSFYAPMACEGCGSEQDVLFRVVDVKNAGSKLPSVGCAKCGKPMEVDDLEDQYLLFMRDA
jgi:hypothetical protein